MNVYEWYIFTEALIGAYILLALYARKKGILERYHLALYGPFIMWKTEKGKALLERLAKKERFWNAYGDMSIAITVGAMISMMVLLLWSAVYVLSIPASRAPEVKHIIGLPGINPVIPLWYGIMALAVAIVIHEGAHGILSLVGKLKIKSLGLLFFIVPVGAFVEPDEEALKEATPRVRDRMAAVGPATNILFAILCAAIFSHVFMAAVEPVEDGILITGIVSDSPAEEAGLKAGMILLNISGEHNGTLMGDVRVLEYDDFHDFMDDMESGDNVSLYVWYEGNRTWINATLEDRYEFTKLKDDRGKGYIGIYLMGVSTEELKETLHHPIASAETPGELRRNMLNYAIVPPFSGLIPFHEPFTDVYEPSGPIAETSEPMFWLLANVFYWLFWLNLMVGISNALPAVPFDGSYLFHDGATAFFTKLGFKKERTEKAVGRSLLFVSLLVFFLVIWQVLGPRVAGALQ